MAEEIYCEVCGEVAIISDVYCNKCGNLLPKENWDNRIMHDRAGQDIPTEFTEIQYEKSKKKKWYKKPKRARPAYHPFEWFFWIGWGIYVFFGFIFVGLKWVVKESFRYLLWCCYWGPPRELNEDK